MKAWPLLLIAALAALLIAALAPLPAPGSAEAPLHEHVGGSYLERGLEQTGLRNLVTAVLLNYRGFDTFGEVVVIFTALMAVLGLARGGGGRTEAAPEPIEPVEPSADDGGVPISPVVYFVVRTLSPFIALFAFAMLLRGHEAPGGGFQAAAVAAALFVALALVLGRARAARLLPSAAMPWWQAAAPLAFVAVGWVGWHATGAFLGFPGPASGGPLHDGMAFVLEFGIAVGGATILARLFLTLED